MHDQQVIDAYHLDLRRTRAASQSIIPVDKTGCWITRIFPQFNDRFEAIAVRVPTINVTAIDLSVTGEKTGKSLRSPTCCCKKRHRGISWYS